MTENIYILSISKGSWDDYYRVNIGAFTEESKAEEAGALFLDKIKKAKEEVKNECPVDKASRLRIEEEYDIEFMESLPDDLQMKYHEWHYKSSTISSFNDEYRIEPLKINEINFLDISEILEF